MNHQDANEQAASWAARLDAGPLDRREADALMRWLDADPENEGRLEELQLLHAKVRSALPVPAGAPAEERTGAARLHPFLVRASALAAAFAVAWVAWVRWPTTLTTAAAQRQAVMLPDGSRAEFNAHTTVQVRMRGAARRLTLVHGEIFLTVAKDRTRPFIVEMPAGEVRVTGTVFNVSVPTPDTMAVILLEGSVEATAGRDGIVRRLEPGDSLVTGPEGSEMRRLDPAALADAVAWREGRVVFHATPLADALGQFARYHQQVVVLAPDVQGLTLGGRFKLDNFDGFLRDLEIALPVRVRRAGEIWRVERKPATEE